MSLEKLVYPLVFVMGATLGNSCDSCLDAPKPKYDSPCEERIPGAQYKYHHGGDEYVLRYGNKCSRHD